MHLSAGQIFGEVVAEKPSWRPSDGCVLFRTYPNQQRAHIATKDALNNEVKVAFGLGNLRCKPGHLRSAYSAICCQLFKPKNMTEDIFLAQILGHKLLPGAAALSVGQSYKEFYVVENP
jgi:telomere resolvase